MEGPHGGSTYTFEAITALLCFGAGHVAKMVILALYLGVLLMVEGYPLVSQCENRAGQPANLPRLPNCVIGIDIFAICVEKQILSRFEYPQSSDLEDERRSADEKRRGQEQNSVVGSSALGDFGRPIELAVPGFVGAGESA